MFDIRILHHNSSRTEGEIINFLRNPYEFGAANGNIGLSSSELKNEKTIIYYYHKTGCRESLVNTLYAHSVNHNLQKVSCKILAQGYAFKKSEKILEKFPKEWNRLLVWLQNLVCSWSESATITKNDSGFEIQMRNLEKGISKYDISLCMWILREPLLVEAVLVRIKTEFTDEEIKSIIIEEMLKIFYNGVSEFYDDGYATSIDFLMLSVALWCREVMDRDFRKQINDSNGPINSLLAKGVCAKINFTDFVNSFLLDETRKNNIIHQASTYFPVLGRALRAASKGLSYNELVNGKIHK